MTVSIWVRDSIQWIRQANKELLDAQTYLQELEEGLADAAERPSEEVTGQFNGLISMVEGAILHAQEDLARLNLGFRHPDES